MNKPNERIRIKDIASKAGVSVGTVDRVLHGRTGVSEASRQKVEEILRQLDYQPNMYASALASNKKYRFACLLPSHSKGEYWVDVEQGMKQAVEKFSDFHVSVDIDYYDQYEVGSFEAAGKRMLEKQPDGMIISPSIESETAMITEKLEASDIPYIFIDSNIERLHPLAFFAQNARQSGCFAARMMRMMMHDSKELVIFRQISKGRLGSNQQLKREEGFHEYIREHCPEITVHEVNLYAKRPGEDEAIIDDFVTKHPEVRYGITFNSKAYVIGEYMLKHKRDDFKLMGYDLLRRNVACLKENAIDFIIAQQPTTQGYNSVESLCNHLILKKTIKSVNYMPITLLSIENIDFYLDALTNNN